MMTVRRFGVLSVGGITGILYAILGLIFGLLYAIIVTSIGAITETGSVYPGLDSGGIGMVWLVGIIIAPIIYGVIGFIFTIISAALYNVIAPRIGGIKVELETETRREDYATS